MVQKAVEENENDKIWDLYQNEYLIARFTNQKLVTFEEFKKPKKKEEINEQEVLEDATNILKSISKPK